MTRRVAIVGAGVAGLRLGGLLQGRGLDVELFDKARGAGGRISTRRLDGGRFDHGAQYFTARDPRFTAQVENWVARGVAAPWRARFAVLERGKVRQESSPSARFVGVPSMSAIARDLADGLSVRTDTRIAGVRRDGSRWVVVLDDGLEMDTFDWVVSAVPAPQAPPLLGASSELTMQARRVPFLACHAAMLRFERPLEVQFDAAFVRGSPLAWIAREASKPGRESSNAWVLHSVPEWSEAHLERPPEQVLDALRTALVEALGSSTPPVPSLASGTVHRWVFARPEIALSGPALWNPGLGLGVCGDWVRGDRVEDAFLSADELAGSMFEDLDSAGHC